MHWASLSSVVQSRHWSSLGHIAEGRMSGKAHPTDSRIRTLKPELEVCSADFYPLCQWNALRTLYLRMWQVAILYLTWAGRTQYIINLTLLTAIKLLDILWTTKSSYSGQYSHHTMDNTVIIPWLSEINSHENNTTIQLICWTWYNYIFYCNYIFVWILFCFSSHFIITIQITLGLLNTINL